MTDTTETDNNLAGNISTPPVPPKKVALYRHKRLFIPLFMSFISLFITFEAGYPVIAFFVYILTGLFLDWWYFEHKKYKDSQNVPEELCQSIGIKLNQIDELNQYMIIARKAALASTISITAASTLFIKDWNWQLVFMVSYFASAAFLACFGMVTKRIIFPYALDKAVGNHATPDHFPNPVNFPNSNDSIDFPKDNFDRLDSRSSAAYWPGGVLDPCRYDSPSKFD